MERVELPRFPLQQPFDGRWLEQLLSAPPLLRSHLPDTPGREPVEQFIGRRFNRVHQAQIHHFLPLLMSLQCRGRIAAALGIRRAGTTPLFLEQYLAAPAQDAINDFTGDAVERWSVAELGNLASIRGGAGHLLFLLAVNVLHQARFEWVVFTATGKVRTMLAHLGLNVIHLAKADPAVLNPGDRRDWGRYYESQPQVVAGQVGQAAKCLASSLVYRATCDAFAEQVGQVAAQLRYPGNSLPMASLAA